MSIATINTGYFIYLKFDTQKCISQLGVRMLKVVIVTGASSPPPPHTHTRDCSAAFRRSPGPDQCLAGSAATRNKGSTEYPMRSGPAGRDRTRLSTRLQIRRSPCGEVGQSRRVGRRVGRRTADDGVTRPDRALYLQSSAPGVTDTDDRTAAAPAGLPDRPPGQIDMTGTTGTDTCSAREADFS